MSRPSQPTWHPLLFAAYPVLLLYSRNLNSVYAGEILPAMGLSLLLTSAAWASLWLATRDPARSGLVVSSLLFLVFSYERNVYALQTNGVIQSPAARERVVLITELIALIGWVWLLRRQAWLIGPLKTTANVASIVLLILLVPSVVPESGLRNDHRDSSAIHRPDTSHRSPPAGPAAAQLPDIYFIVLDAYGRSDVLGSMVHYDNRAWLDRMLGKGFYLARQSTANYCQTALSISSTLRGEYLDPLAGSDSPSRIHLRERLAQSRLVATMRVEGYKVVNFASGFGITDGFPADERWSPPWDLGDFNTLMLDMTPLWPALGMGTGQASHWMHRQRILYLFSHLDDVAEDPAPTFCLAHVVAPHPPFVFDREGHDVSKHSKTYRLTDGRHWSDLEGHGGPDDYAAHYRAQASYVSDQVEAVVDRILARSSTPPIIIIQGDHGPGTFYDSEMDAPNDLVERMSILNLLLVPQKIRDRLYPSITPVNTFRLISDELFGTALGFLPDRNYYSPYQRPYRFVDVTTEIFNQAARLGL